MIIISPGEIAEQLLKSGDSIMNLHAGRDTRRYLTRQVLGIGFFSATVMSICLGIPMLLQLKGGIEQRTGDVSRIRYDDDQPVVQH